MPGVNTEAAERAAGTQTTQAIFECFLQTQRFDGDISAAAGQFFDFRDDVAFLRIEDNVRAHLPRHFHSHGIAINPNDEGGTHQFRACGRAKANGSLRKNNDGVAKLDVGGFRPAETRRRNVGEEHDLFVVQLVGNLCEVCLSIRNQEIFRLGAIDGVAEAPAANRFHAFAVSALRPLRRQASTALSARCDRADEHTIANRVSGDAFAEFFDYSDRLVSNDETRLHGIFSAQNVKIRAANGRERDSDHSLTDTGARAWHLFEPNVVRSMKNVRPHGGSRSPHLDQFVFFCMDSLNFTRAACSRRIITSLMRLNSSYPSAGSASQYSRRMVPYKKIALVGSIARASKCQT